MKQIICKSCYDTNFPSVTQYIGLNNGAGAFSSTDTFGIDYAKHPWSVSGTFRNFTAYSGDTHREFTLTLMVNGVATALVVTLTSGATFNSNNSDEVSITAGDDVTVKVVGTGGAGFPSAFSIEFEGDNSSYGISPTVGTFAAGDGFVGGAFGNGVFENTLVDPTTDSNTYSICAVEGSITRLDLKSYTGAPGTGVWTGRIILNNVIQDGAGGTIDTTCILTGADISTFSSFNLPVVPTDHLEIYVKRSVTTAIFAVAQVGVSVEFTADTDGQYMMCGGNNDTLSITDPGWMWTRSIQLETSEVRAASPIGLSGFNAIALYAEIGGTLTAGVIRTITLRKNSTDTDITFDITSPDTEGQVVANASFVNGDLINVIFIPSGVVNAVGQFHWGIGVGLVGGTLIIRKVTNPPGSVQSFEFTGTDLTPSTFFLLDGESQTFEDLEDGTYGIAETPVLNWDSSYEVSNDDPIDAIEIEAGETVTVTFTNTVNNPSSGIYKITPNKRTDTLWDAEFSGTVEVKIP